MRRGALVTAILVLALAPAACLAWLWRDMPHFGHLHDDSIYFVCAKSLALGQGYRILSLPGRPWQTKYPPLLPALLAGVWKIAPQFPENLKLGMLVAWAPLPVYLLLAFQWFRKTGLTAVTSAVLSGSIALSPCVISFSTSLMSELLFSCFLLSALLTIERAGNASAAVAGLLAGAAYLTKVAALPLMVTVPALLLLRGQRRRALIFATVMAPCVLAWTGWAYAHQSASTDIVTLYYTNYLGFQLYNVGVHDLPILIWKNLDGIFGGISGLMIFEITQSPWGVLLARVLALGATLGTVRLARYGGWTQFHAFAGAYVGILLVWHYRPNERFLLPVYALFLAGFAVELRHVMQLVRRRLRGGRLAERIVAWSTASLIAGMALGGAWLNARAVILTFPGIVRQHRGVLASNRLAFAWIAHYAPDGAFFAYDDPVLFLYTGRPATAFPIAPMPFYYQDRESILRPFRSMAAFAREQNLSYLFRSAADFHRELGDSERDEVNRILTSDPAFATVYQGALTSIYHSTAPRDEGARALPALGAAADVARARY
jgi:hypothetical protein